MATIIVSHISRNIAADAIQEDGSGIRGRFRLTKSG
jgi:hypothetical protein